MKIGIMQPYFFPYIGYFQLIVAVDKFIFYDDVNFIKNGWINRNRILLKGESHYLTVRLKDASSYKLINEVEFIDNRLQLLKTLEHAYKKAPFFNEVMPLIQDVFTTFKEVNSISKIAEISVKKVSQYLNINTLFESSSEVYPITKKFRKESRLIAICKKNYSDTYINPTGGKELYNKSIFNRKGIKLFFIKNSIPSYNQFNNDFIPGLSIIDVMMFNPPDLISDMINQYDLE